MKVRVGCYVKDYLVGKGDTVIGAWSVRELGCTEGGEYKIKGISPNKELTIENDNGVTKEYSPVLFLPYSDKKQHIEKIE